MTLPADTPEQVKELVDEHTKIVIIGDGNMNDGNAGESAICGEHSEAIRRNADAIGKLTKVTGELRISVVELTGAVAVQNGTMKTIKRVGYIILAAIVIEILLPYVQNYIR